MPITLEFESTLPVSPERAWAWITHVDYLREEMRPWLWMSIPRDIRSLEDFSFAPGRPLFTSWLWLFGCLPLGTSRLTLQALTPGIGFIEESPMTGMRLWRHERNLHAVSGGTRIVDRLTVEPLFGNRAVKVFLLLFFSGRHRTLRRRAS
ncbi:hypothetical protein [Pseudomonas sp. LFM046]|uniref:hypothetical protein n=1 Tax=Pseudomonas sp. LFM046 TaxID=1608357 RepID=UPI0005CFD11D|nr:hypothetical protein [Pseudomonas sp. LFM046]